MIHQHVTGRKREAGSMREALEDNERLIENWIECFDMVMTDSGKWTWDPFIKKHNDLIDEYNDLVRRWNKIVPLIRQQNVGRPLAASDPQRAQVLKLRKVGRLLRGIAKETSLSLNTVRTVIAKQSGSDRTSKMHRGRIEIDHQQQVTWKRQRRAIDALPRRINQVLGESHALVKESKGG